MSTSPSVCIVRLGAFGDIIHSLPLAADLHAAGCRLSWVCEDRWRPLLAGSPAIEHLITWPRAEWKRIQASRTRQCADLRRLARRLRRQQFDWIIDAQGLAKSALLCASAGCARLSHGPQRAREGAWLLSRRRSAARSEHVIDQQRELGLTLLGRQHPRGGWRFPLPAWQAEKHWARRWLQQHGLLRPLCLNVGAGWPTKVWPEAQQIACCRQARAAGLPVVVVWGSPSEQAVAQSIVAAVPGCQLAPPTSLPQLAGLLDAVGALISGDTGPLHLAQALGTPAVGLFGPVPHQRNGVRGTRYRNFQAPGAAWERRDVRRVDMAAIAPEAVLTAARAIGAFAKGPAG